MIIEWKIVEKDQFDLDSKSALVISWRICSDRKLHRKENYAVEVFF